MFNKNFAFVMRHYNATVIALSALLFVYGYLNFNSRQMLLVLNGIYIGQMFAILTMFLPYFLWVIVTNEPYTRARQYALTTGLQHLGYLLVVTYSIRARSYGGNGAVEVDLQLLLSRYVILMAGFLQIMAPDFGKPLMYGLNRKVLWIGSLFGLIAAVGVILLQFWPVLVVPSWLDQLLAVGE